MTRSRVHLVIPVFLNLLLLAGIPYFKTPGDPGVKAILVVLGLALPWIVHFAVSELIRNQRVANAKRRQEDENSDFV